MSSILIKNPLICARMNDKYNTENLLDTFSGGHIYIKDDVIESAGPDKFSGSADIEINAKNSVVLPGLVNTHHHFFQNLTRNIYSTQQSKLFNWLNTNYNIWRDITGQMIEVSAKVAITELLKTGCTTTSDHLYLFPEKADENLMDREINLAKKLGIRFHPTRGSMSLGKSEGGLPHDDIVQNEKDIKDDIERVVEKYHDESFGSMLKIALAPSAPFTVTKKLMRKTVDISKKYDLQIHTHLAETTDETEYCLDKFGKRPVELIESLDWLNKNAWFAHFIHLNDEEIEKAGQAKVGASHCPSSNMRLGSGIARVKELLEAGVNVGLAVDGSSSNDTSNMFLEMRNALLLSRMREQDNWLTADEVLWMATMGGTKALGRNDIGQIKEGKIADIIIMSMDQLEYSGAKHDPLSAMLFSTSMNPADYVIINGNIIVENGEVTNVDENNLSKEHNKLSDELISRAETRMDQQLRRPK